MMHYKIRNLRKTLLFLLVLTFISALIFVLDTTQEGYSSRTREDLTHAIINLTNSIVVHGPFAGMKISTKSNIWGDNDIASKLLGMYECVLHPILYRIQNEMFDTIINIGCADGFYAIGLAIMFPNAKIIAYDINEAAKNAVEHNAKINGILPTRIHFYTSLDNLNQQISGKTLIIMDCEGCEAEILNPTISRNLKHTRILVECHDFANNTITPTLIQRFENSHYIETIVEQPQQPPQLENFTRHEMSVVLAENRPVTMHWLYMSPFSEQPT